MKAADFNITFNTILRNRAGFVAAGTVTSAIIITSTTTTTTITG